MIDVKMEQFSEPPGPAKLLEYPIVEFIGSDPRAFPTPRGIFHRGVGVIRYSHTPEYGYRCVCEVERDLADYARALIPKGIGVYGTRYHPHISIVRYETPTLEEWGRREGQEVVFVYDMRVRNNGGVYWWLNVDSPELKVVREELGLAGSSRLSRPPDGIDCFHLTVANSKERK